jgi:hypothetical protein
LPIGRVLQDVFRVRVTAAARSRQACDYFDLLCSITGKDAFMGEVESGCKLPWPVDFLHG